MASKRTKKKVKKRTGYDGRKSYPVTVSLSFEQHEDLRDVAAMANTTHSAVIRRGIRLVSEEVVKAAEIALSTGREPDYSRLLKRADRDYDGG